MNAFDGLCSNRSNCLHYVMRIVLVNGDSVCFKIPQFALKLH